MDWSVWDSLYDYTDDGWKDELEDDNGLDKIRDDGVQASCGTTLPIEDESASFRLSADAYPTSGAALRIFEEATRSPYPADDDRWTSQEMDDIEGCEMQRRDARYDEDHFGTDPRVALWVTCAADNLFILVKINGHHLIDGDIGELDAIAHDAMAPLITEAYGLAEKTR